MCPRPVRRRLTFDEESANKLFQEIYDESHNLKAKITRLFTKWELKIKEGGLIQAHQVLFQVQVLSQARALAFIRNL